MPLRANVVAGKESEGGGLASRIINSGEEDLENMSR